MTHLVRHLDTHAHDAISPIHRWIIVIGVLIVLLIDPLVCHTSCKSIGPSIGAASVELVHDIPAFVCSRQVAPAQTPDLPPQHSPLTHHSHVALIVVVLALVSASLCLAYAVPYPMYPPFPPPDLRFRPPIFSAA